MLAFFRFFSIFLVVLCSCSGSRHTAQKANPKPYYFSNKSNAGKKLTPPISGSEVAARQKTPDARLQPAQQESKHRAGSAPDTKQKNCQNPESAERETPVLSRFAAVKPTEKPRTETDIKPAGNSSRKSADGWLLAGASLFMAGVAGLFTLFGPQTRNVAHWARQNKKKSWFLIGFLQLVLGFQATFFGRVLHELGLQSSETITHILLASAALAFVFYPRKKPKTEAGKNQHFRKGKLLLLGLLVSTFFGFVSLGNRSAADNAISPLSTKLEQVTLTDEALIHSAAASLTAVAQPGSPAVVDGLAALLIFFSVLVAAYLLLIVAALSCSIMCSGAGGAALLVLLGGSALVIWGLVVVIKEAVAGANRRKGVKESTVPEPPRDPKAPRPRKQKIEWF